MNPDATHPAEQPSRSRLREVFLDCLEASSPEERRRRLDAGCAGDAALRRTVEELLANDVDDGFLDAPADGVRRPPSGPAAAGPALGSWIGPYQLEREIGAGGCGIVFAARQLRPVRRRVALKIIRPGMDSRAVIARFEVERQALALMEHPHIARVLDAGTTPSGQPFFAMELVDGIGITRFCDEHRLDLEARLRLFLRVAAALEHAHERQIVHRDLKPSNILVSWQDGEPWPRVIDFGVAKAVGPELSGLNTFTVPGVFLGTPAYMSPEQADLRSSAVDRRSDVYSLGALLYELLAGVPPFDPGRLAAGGLEAMRRTIQETDPPPPSVSVRQFPAAVAEATAANRGRTPARLVRELSRDADWIVLKTLEKEPDRRYASAAELASDIVRLLAHEPILARPPGRVYRLRKLVRRHPVAAVATAAFLLPLLIGAGAVWWQARETGEAKLQVELAQRQEQLQRERWERAREDEARQRLQAVSLSKLARRQEYAADLNLAQQALAADNLGRAVALLDAQRPGPLADDLRGWEWRYLWRRTRSEAEFVLGRTTNEVASLGLSADGRWLAVVEGPGQGSIWDVDQRRRVFNLPRGGWLESVRFSPTEPVAAFLGHGETRGSPGEVILWSAGSGRVTGRIPLAGAPLGLAFSVDGGQLLAASASGELERWTVDTLRKSGRTVAPPARPFGLVLAANGDLSRVAYVDREDRLVWVDARTGEVRWRSSGNVREIRRLTLSPDGAVLVATGGPRGNGQLARWSTAEGRELPPLAGHSAWVADAAYLPRGDRLVSAGADQTLRVWSVDDGRPLRTLRGHRLEVWSVAVSAGVGRVVSGSKDGELLVWDPDRPPADPGSIRLPGAIRSWGFAEHDGALVTLDESGLVGRWEDPGRRPVTELFRIGPTRFGGVMSADGNWLAVGSQEGGIAVWNVRTGEKVTTVGTKSDFRIPVALADGGTNLITLQPRDHAYVRWRLPDGMALETWSANSGFRGFNTTAFHVAPEGGASRFVSIAADGQADLHGAVAGRTTPFELGLPQISGAAFAPDGLHLAVSSGRGRAALWQLDPPRRVAEFGGFLLGTHGIGYSPDGERLAVTSVGREGVKLFDPENQMELLTLDAGENQMLSHVRFSPDGKWLGASGPDGAVRLWRAPTLEEINAAEGADR